MLMGTVLPHGHVWAMLIRLELMETQYIAVRYANNTTLLSKIPLPRIFQPCT